MWRTVEAELVRRVHARPDVRALAQQLEREVAAGTIPSAVAAARLVDAALRS